MKLLSINDVSATEIRQLFTLVDTKYEMSSPGKIVANLFYEPSTRTRLSFELAARRIGADVITFDPETSSEQKGESMKDTALTLQALGVDILVIRHAEKGMPYEISRWVNCSVINAGDGTREHPTQALLDLYTIKQWFGQIAGLRVGIVGDVKYSRVAHSLYLALAKMGAVAALIGPRELVSSRPGQSVSYDFDAEIPKLDVCYMLRRQAERYRVDEAGLLAMKRLDTGDFKLTKERAVNLHGIVMHPGPMNRDVEIDSDVADGPKSVIQKQVTNGVKVRAALLHWMFMRGSENAEVLSNHRDASNYFNDLSGS